MSPKKMEMGNAGRALRTIPKIRLVTHRPCKGAEWTPLSAVSKYNVSPEFSVTSWSQQSSYMSYALLCYKPIAVWGQGAVSP